MNTLDRVLRLALPFFPKFIVERVSRRYIAGSLREDALRTIRALNDEGAMATVDYLGEEARTPGQAQDALEEYLGVLEAVWREGLDCNLSIKPTLFGLRLSEEMAFDKIEELVIKAGQYGIFVRLDMEDHGATDATLSFYRRLREKYPNVGVVLQAMLHRTTSDVRELVRQGTNVRLCKGIYREPRAIAWQPYETVRANYLQLLRLLLDGKAYVGIATHDEHLVWGAVTEIESRGLERTQYEFQMLLGVEPALRKILIGQGHRLRVYVPYGQDWYAYSIRRLKENPTIALHVIRDFFSR